MRERLRPEEVRLDPVLALDNGGRYRNGCDGESKKREAQAILLVLQRRIPESAHRKVASDQLGFTFNACGPVRSIKSSA